MLSLTAKLVTAKLRFTNDQLAQSLQKRLKAE